jgi:hypothetical protein
MPRFRTVFAGAKSSDELLESKTEIGFFPAAYAGLFGKIFGSSLMGSRFA